MALGVERIVVALGSHGQCVQQKCRNSSGRFRGLRESDMGVQQNAKPSQDLRSRIPATIRPPAKTPAGGDRHQDESGWLWDGRNARDRRPRGVGRVVRNIGVKAVHWEVEIEFVSAKIQVQVGPIRGRKAEEQSVVRGRHYRGDCGVGQGGLTHRGTRHDGARLRPESKRCVEDGRRAISILTAEGANERDCPGLRGRVNKGGFVGEEIVFAAAGNTCLHCVTDRYGRGPYGVWSITATGLSPELST
jgi:hypothetical protein